MDWLRSDAWVGLLLATWLIGVARPTGARAQEHLPPVAPPPAREPEAGWELTVFPVVFYGTETRWGLGVGSWLVDHDNRDNEAGHPDNLWLSVTYTQERQAIAWIIPEFFYHHGRSRLLVDAQYRQFPTRFFGLGNDTRADQSERYTPRIGRVQSQFTTRVVSRWSFGPYVEYHHVRIVRTEDGGRLNSGTVPGAQGSTLAGIGPLLRWDNRDRRFQPRSGVSAELVKAWYRSQDQNHFAFTRVSGDLRGYLDAGGGHVLAAQALASSIAGEAPFTSLPELGGRFLFRGVFEGRYRDRNLLAAQTEYRFPIRGRWRGVAFAAYGAVAPTPEALREAGYHTAGGLGLRYRYNDEDRINVRLDLAVAEDSRGAYLSVGEAF